MASCTAGVEGHSPASSPSSSSSNCLGRRRPPGRRLSGVTVSTAGRSPARPPPEPPASRPPASRDRLHQSRDPAVPHLVPDLSGDIQDVVSLVAIRGHWEVDPERLRIARRDTPAETVHLPAEIVDVELRGHVVAAEPQQALQSVSVRRVAAVPHM